MMIHIKTKVKMYREELNTSFQGKKIPKEDVPCKFLSLIILDSISEVNKKYHSQKFLEESKFKMTEAKKKNIIIVDFDSSSSDESDNESDIESKKTFKNLRVINDESDN